MAPPRARAPVSPTPSSPTPSDNKFSNEKQLSPRRVEQLKEESKKDKLPTPDFIKSVFILKKVPKHIPYQAKKVTFEEIQRKFSSTDGGWGDSSDDEM